MSQVLDKRPADSRYYDIDCSALLLPDETITSISNISVDAGGVTFGTPQVNTMPITYPSGLIAQVGKVCQVLMTGGTIPPNQESLICNVHAFLVTSLNPALDATVQLRLVNQPNL